MADKIGIALLAAGKGTRLKVNIAKPLLPMLGLTMVDFVVESINKFLNVCKITGHIGVIVGHEKELVEDRLSIYPNISFAWQKKQLGTADALKSYFKETKGAWDTDYTLVICADTPLITSKVLETLYEKIKMSPSCNAVCATFNAADPHGLGRIIRGFEKGFIIVEHKDATDEVREITEVNSGLYLIKTSYIKENLDSISSENASNEFYLTDIFKDGEDVEALLFADEMTFNGVNTLAQWQEVNAELQKIKNHELLLSGVFIHDPVSTYIDWAVQIGAGSEIFPGVSIKGSSAIGDNVIIENSCVINNSEISKGSRILAMSHLDGAVVQENCSIGPFARLRPAAEIGAESKIGNFVEIKKSKLHRGVKVSHLSYVGDAEIGDEANIGCGFITCNYDGANKHKTIIGPGSFIGSDVQMIAPVKIGSNAFVAAGSTITSDIEDGGFGIARQKQTTKAGLAKRFMKKK
jgi:bifunctional UDP-N-acetylglucosamine pyrophosphorylase / glucosamine-1-phosphate N-acetyltransferase